MYRKKPFKVNHLLHSLTPEHILFLCILFLILLGSVIGAILANTTAGSELNELNHITNSYIQSFENPLSSKQIFAASFFKTIRPLFIIWLGGFFMPGVAITAIMLVTKGLGIGFTSAIFIKQYGLIGLLISTLSLLPQHLIIIPAYAFIAYKSIHKTIFTPQVHFKQKDHYSFLLIFCLCISVLCAFIETFIIPIFMQTTLSFL